MSQRQIPIEVIMRAVSALKAVKDMPVGITASHSTWAAVMRSHNELQMYLERLTKGIQVEVSTPA